MWRHTDTADDNGYARERARMIDTQIAGRGVTDARVLEALQAVPRHRFVPPDRRLHAYEDHPIEIGSGQTISQPYMVGLMTQELAPKPADRILEIGTGSGYQTAILATLAAEVISIERQERLAEDARQRLRELGYDNVTVLHGDGTVGYAESAPYDGILVTAGGPETPESLKQQLADAGRLVCPVGPRSCQRLVRIVRTGDDFVEHTGIHCVFVPLIGAEGWQDD